MRLTASLPYSWRLTVAGCVSALAAMVLFLGCSPQTGEESQPPAAVHEPAPPVLRILTDLENPRAEDLRLSLADRTRPLFGGELAWTSIGDGGESNWDVALVAFPALENLLPAARDLTPLLDRDYPPYPQDFFLPTQAYTREGRLVSLPILFSPDFLYAKNAEEWRSQWSRAFWDQYVQAGSKVAGPSGLRGEWWRKSLSIPNSQWVELGEDPLDNAFTRGEVETAIWDRSWLLADRSRGRQMLPLDTLVSDRGVPAWALHILLAEGSENSDNAEKLFRALVVDFQETLMNWGGRGLPIRRSIYQSPRMQGAFLGAPRSVFDKTLEALIEPAPSIEE